MHAAALGNLAAGRVAKLQVKHGAREGCSWLVSRLPPWGNLHWFVSLPDRFWSVGIGMELARMARGPSFFPPMLKPPSLIRASRERASILLFLHSRAPVVFLGRQKED